MKPTFKLSVICLVLAAGHVFAAGLDGVRCDPFDSRENEVANSNSGARPAGRSGSGKQAGRRTPPEPQTEGDSSSSTGSKPAGRIPCCKLCTYVNGKLQGCGPVTCGAECLEAESPRSSRRR